MLNNQPHILQNRMYPLPSEEAGFETTKCCLLSMTCCFFQKEGSNYHYSSHSHFHLLIKGWVISTLDDGINSSYFVRSVQQMAFANPANAPKNNPINWDTPTRSVSCVTTQLMTQIEINPSKKPTRNPRTNATTFIFRFFLMNGEVWNAFTHISWEGLIKIPVDATSWI